MSSSLTASASLSSALRPRGVWLLLTRADKVLIFAVLILLVGLLVDHLVQPLKPATGFLVSVGSDFREEFELNRDQILEFDGPLGRTWVESAGGMVWIRSAPCSEQICVARGTLLHPGEMSVCLPNKLVLRIVGAASPLDGISR